jgi:hypothetical protein
MAKIVPSPKGSIDPFDGSSKNVVSSKEGYIPLLDKST